MRDPVSLARWAWLGVAALLLCGAFAGVRARAAGDFAGAENLEASYHVLLTVRALDESPASEHYFLPTVTLGSPLDKGIPWGLAQPTARGDMLYTSFSPAGFLLPWAVFKALHVEPSLEALAALNAVLQVLSAALLVALVVTVLRGGGFDPAAIAAGAIAAAGVQLLSREGLQAFGFTYWHQAPFQVLLLLQLLLLARMVRQDAPAARWHLPALGALAFAGAYMEWTGLVLDAGAAAALAVLARHRGSRLLRGAAIVVALGGALSVVVLVTHFAAALGLRTTLVAFGGRFVARAAPRGEVGSLLLGYVKSFGPLLAVVPAIVIAGARGAACVPAAWRRYAALVLALATVPVLENLVLAQHATEFSFDRVKVCVPLGLALAIGVAALRERWRPAALALVAAALVVNVLTFERENARYAGWGRIDAANRRLVAGVAQRVDLRCAVIATNATVRGYTSLLLGRGVHEIVPSAFAPLVRDGENCGGLYLEGRSVFPDLPEYTDAYLLTREQAATSR